MDTVGQKLIFQLACLLWQSLGGTTLGASLLGTCSCLPQWCKKDSGDSVRLPPGCDVSFRVAPAPLTLSEEVYLMGLWRHLTPTEAAHPSPARDWLTRCNPNLSPDQAYFQYQEISREDRWALFSFANAWSASHRDHPAIKRAICQMHIPKLEKLVLIRFQGLHPPWVGNAEWEFLMWFALAVERNRSWSAALQQTDPRHPGYNDTQAKVTPDPVIVECSGLGGGDLQLAQPWHVCVKTNKHNQRIYGPSMALVEESIRVPDKSMIHLTGLGLTKSLQEFLVLQYYATDSASSWHSLLQDWFPQVNWTPPGRLRHQVRELYKTLHIAPSHRRMPHPCWTGPMNLTLSLLLGEGHRRIAFLLKPQELQIDPLPRLASVLIRGFSAGSFVGLSLLHLLWQWDNIYAGGEPLLVLQPSWIASL